MTRFPKDGGKQPPLRRLVSGGEHGDLVLELTERTVTLRPKGTRSPQGVAMLTWGAIYQRGLMAAIDAQRRRRP